MILRFGSEQVYVLAGTVADLSVDTAQRLRSDEEAIRIAGAAAKWAARILRDLKPEENNGRTWQEIVSWPSRLEVTHARQHRRPDKVGFW